MDLANFSIEFVRVLPNILISVMLLLHSVVVWRVRFVTLANSEESPECVLLPLLHGFQNHVLELYT